ncbi:saccharolysin [Anaeramoeba flamelloides]|uniref:Saccharolysin n=1 Tax=Anaeramoeba flamelloides TaxID=1746091 RepID=A0ABQ8Z5U4_9EUKA|nr:saccharolysin [Anaeramoeba flamelloides]
MSKTINFLVEPEEIEERTKKIQESVLKTNDSIANLKTGTETFVNTLLPLYKADNEMIHFTNFLDLLSEVSLSEEVRKKCRECREILSKFSIEQDMRVDLFQSLNAFNETEESKTLKGEHSRYLEKMLRDFKRDGLDLSEEKREELKKLRKIISTKEIEYNKNITEDVTKLSLTKEQLAGMEEDFFGGLKKDPKDESKYLIEMKYFPVFPILKECTNEETRKQVFLKYGQRAGSQNVEILEYVAGLRDKCAKILGFPTHYEFQTEINMSKNPKNVHDFLTGVLEKLPFEEELEQLKTLKRKLNNLNENDECEIQLWDWRFLHQYLMKTKYAVDETEIKEYFPMEFVLEKLFEIFELLYSITFKEVTDEAIWAPEVKRYEIWDKEDPDFLIGIFYLDLYPRDGKFSHFAEFPIMPSFTNFDEQGNAISRQAPHASLICNFNKPTKEKPSLLKHDDVVTMYHEAGHLFHELLTRSTLSEFSGTNVESDFLEAPSQMNEFFCWNKDSLKKISKHYKTNKPLPDELIEKMIAAKNVNIGIIYRRQIFFGLWDYTLHTQPETNTQQLSATLRKKLCGMNMHPDLNIATNFGHMVWNYDANYYGYLWSLVYAADLFTKFEEGGVFSKEIGMQFRKKCLEIGGTKDGMEIMEDFLGRKPNNLSFLKSIGVYKN